MTELDPLLTILAGLAGGLGFHRLRLPGGSIIGALLAAGALHLWQPQLEPLGPGIRTAAQILIGTSIGAATTRQPFRELTRMRWPVTWLLLGMVVVTSAFGAALGTWTELSLGTIWLATLPGSINDVVAVALDFEQDVGLIAAFHVVRQIFVLGLVPWLVIRATERGP